MNTLQDVSSKLKDYHYSGTAFLPKIAIGPLAQEKNCSCKCLVSPGEFVKEGDVIARPSSGDGYKSVIHSPIPGEVIDIISTTCPNGNLENAVRIKLGGQFSYTGKPSPAADWQSLSASAIITKITEYGIINTFLTYEPSSLGEQIKKQQKRKNRALIVRFFDEDFLRISDSLYTKFFFDEILLGTEVVAKAMDATEVVFVIDDHFDQNYLEYFSRFKNSHVLEINSGKYPAGFKREITQAFNKLFKKTNNISISQDDLYVDSCTMYDVYKGIVTGVPSISKYIHFSGNCLNASSFLDVKLGFRIKDVVAQLGGFKEQPALVVINGLVCGYTVNSMDIPITKYVKSIEFVSEFKTTDYHIYECILCGSCRYVCPVNLSPDILYNYMVNGTENLKKYSPTSLLCTECGLCNTVCTARLPLCQTITALKENIEKTNKDKN